MKNQETESQQILRRDFLRTGIAASTLSALSPTVFAAENEKPIRVGLIGCGWYGKTDLFHLIQVANVEVVGLCDVDQLAVEHAAELVAKRQKSGNTPKTYRDYQKLLKEQKPEIVLVGTPDHWHCLPMIEACKMGADVYVQKPISFDVVEGQAMLAAARKYDRTVQVGLQRRSTPHLLGARDQFIKSGKLGKIGYVDIHSYYGSWDQFPPAAEPPKTIDWNTYIGPAPWREYNPKIHPKRWRSFKEFSNGQTGDLCVHFFDTIRYFLGLGWPKSISATGGILMRDRSKSPANTHDTQTALFNYDDIQVVWDQKNWGTSPESEYPWGATIYGDKGTLKLSVWKYEFTPKGKGETVKGTYFDESDRYPEDKQHKETEIFAAPATRRHMLNFLAARKGNKRPVSDIEEGHISSASCILANLSMELGRSLEWDAKNGRVVDDEEANQKLARPYRKPWIHPTPESV